MWAPNFQSFFGLARTLAGWDLQMLWGLQTRMFGSCGCLAEALCDAYDPEASSVHLVISRALKKLPGVMRPYP